ncbi:PBP1A family penicillin-binding protein, partial [Bacillaceae bacterium SIJ1]|uniref:transglycosylase domain-containing protein n=1 Tax=Litoribacterium kuwaitense TaxID=1398745 RepID=UPI0013EBBFC2
MFIAITAYLSILYAGDYIIDEEKLVFDAASELVDEDGQLLTKLYVQNRDPVTADHIPDHVKQAFVAVEDSRFYDHHGLDLRSIGRAVVRNVQAGGKVEGGSTITQQLAKNVFLSADKTWLRKAKEAVIALQLENRYSKEKILELYLNRIYFGHGAYGLGAAANTYFGKTVDELTVDEGALLAAIPKAPTHYSPIEQPDSALERRNLILSLMADQGFLTAEEAVRYKGRTMHASLHGLGENPAFYTYIDLVLEDAAKRYQLSREEVLTGGYTIEVPLDEALQEKIHQAFVNQDNFPQLGEQTSQGSFVMLDNKTGAVIAAEGGREYVPRGFNRIYAKRQPGSVFKPLAVYGPALDLGYGPYALLEDQQQSYGSYSPTNYNGVYQGQQSMYDAVISSGNAAAVWLLNEIGLERGKEKLLQAGVPVQDEGLPMALGGTKEGITPMSIATMYRAFANEGKTSSPHVITALYDQEGELVEAKVPEDVSLFSKQTAWYMTRMLEGVMAEGTGAGHGYGGAIAGKTGTTQYDAVQGGNRDLW